MTKKILIVALFMLSIVPSLAKTNKEIKLEMTLYRQADSLWANEKAMFCNKTIGSIGCAITSTAMVLDYYGFNETPSTLTKKLEEWACPLEWDAIETRFGLHIVRKDSKLDKEQRLLDKDYIAAEMVKMLDKGYPVILGLENTRTQATHFIVIYGYKDSPQLDFYILDPSVNSNYIMLSDVSSEWNYHRMVVYQQ